MKASTTHDDLDYLDWEPDDDEYDPCDHDEWEHQENRRQWWRDLYWTLTAPLRTLRRWWTRRTPQSDDDIPF